MPTEWAKQHRERAAGERRERLSNDFLSQPVLQFGERSLLRWQLGLMVVLIFAIGPSALGYGIIIIAAVYLKRFLKGKSLEGLKSEYMENVRKDMRMHRKTPNRAPSATARATTAAAIAAGVRRRKKN